MIKYSESKKTWILKSLLLLVLPFGAISWILLPIPGTTLHLAFMMTEIVSVFVFAFLFLRMLKLKMSISRILPAAFERIFAGISILFFVYIAAVTLWRFVATGFDADYLSYPRICFVLFVVYAFLGTGLIAVPQRQFAVLTLTSIVNAIELIFFILNGELRIIAGFVNVNIYACGVIMTIPFLLQLFFSQNSLPVRLVVAFNLFVCTLLIPITGSRLGLFLVVFSWTGSIVCFVRKQQIVRMLQSIVPVVLALVCLVGICTLGQNKNVLSSVLRASMMDRVFEIENQDLTYQEVGTTGEVELVSTSDTMRSDLWKQAVEEIKRYPLTGTGKMTFNVFVSGRYVEQSPHNFLLEMLMNFGIIGTLLYLSGLVCMLWFILRSCNKQNKKTAFLSLAVFGGFSMMQPTFVSYFLLIWFVLLMFSFTDKEKKEIMLI